MHNFRHFSGDSSEVRLFFRMCFQPSEAFLLTVFKGVLWGIGIAVGVSVLMIAAGQHMIILSHEHLDLRNEHGIDI